MSEKRDDGGPVMKLVFVMGDLQQNDMRCLEDVVKSMSCLTIRDFFAGQALAGMLANDHDVDIDCYPAWAYDYANAMLKERERGEK